MKGGGLKTEAGVHSQFTLQNSILLQAMDSFRLELFTPGHVYFSGQEIQGQVHIHLSETKKMRKLKVELRGEGRVEWSETESVQRWNSTGETTMERETVHYRSSERYLDREIVLFHGPQLAVGDHVFPFILVLGSDLPCSYEGDHGHIRYYLQAVIVRESNAMYYLPDVLLRT